MKKTLQTIFAISFTVFFGSPAFTQDVGIQQIPEGAIPVDENAEGAIKANNNQDTGDFQSQIMNDPSFNDRARAEAAMNASKQNNGMDGVTGANMNAAKGNTAVIVQHGKSNKSSITQHGRNNTAIQTQTGKHNDLKVDQTGNNNHSVEHQTGDYNHKVKIQNGKKTEETITDDDDPQETKE